ncbi:Phage tail assembly chaperone protein [uncultured Caudovirales phage]|uniref:Phage tail assembly chaperone protein n=1 Tax=uncultured Caudovirales phage TaxID=2100421 RepID=A0A6J5RX65_9CAUD|nr:Phage tail assembly chaperone protein [uncultured Caudovirales phage]CAB4184042.1 Phage tail assembly chaperone protein [uncultured Caudovirales phage]CAB4203327.1 Phage tail assembly chaperone protein [uncultured Caudovirales phage]
MSIPNYITAIWSDEITMTHIRYWRNSELSNTDWTQLADAQCDKAAWATYRQSLRDLPAQNEDPQKLVFPTRPA